MKAAFEKLDSSHITITSPLYKEIESMKGESKLIMDELRHTENELQSSTERENFAEALQSRRFQESLLRYKNLYESASVRILELQAEVQSFNYLLQARDTSFVQLELQLTESRNECDKHKREAERIKKTHERAFDQSSILEQEVKNLKIELTTKSQKFYNERTALEALCNELEFHLTESKQTIALVTSDSLQYKQLHESEATRVLELLNEVEILTTYSHECCQKRMIVEQSLADTELRLVDQKQQIGDLQTELSYSQKKYEVEKTRADKLEQDLFARQTESERQKTVLEGSDCMLLHARIKELEIHQEKQQRMAAESLKLKEEIKRLQECIQTRELEIEASMHQSEILETECKSLRLSNENASKPNIAERVKRMLGKDRGRHCPDSN
ncbi:hypothetical protein BC830DRAFT_95875 [Chytriomyces sp. MP71]|nr:hypothetical protein BC830DRAFT_95875 [Chytriomyces sp. MP71]